MSEVKDPIREEFFTWFMRILYKTDSCFERDVLRDNKENLFKSWKERLGDTYEDNKSDK